MSDLPPIELTAAEVRRLAIHKQYLAGDRPPATAEGVMDVFRRLGCIQLDPIRAVERTQYLVLWSRLGAYERRWLHELQFAQRRLFEYWAHAASIVLTEHYPLHRYEMQRARSSTGGGAWAKRFRDWVDANAPFRDYVLAELAQRGVVDGGELEDRALVDWVSGGWTSSRNVTMMLDHLWSHGHIMVADRQGLRRLWIHSEHYFGALIDAPPLKPREVTRAALQIALKALGVATETHIRNHFMRGSYPHLAEVLQTLVREQIVLPVTIRDGWPGNWYLHADDLPLLAQLHSGGWQPRTTLLSPFDNLICDRKRTELLWDFDYRIEIYVPASKRQYGYYVLPVLHGERLIGRISPKMDYKRHILTIDGVYAEPDAPRDAATTTAVRQALHELAHWLGARTLEFTPDAARAWPLDG